MSSDWQELNVHPQIIEKLESKGMNTPTLVQKMVLQAQGYHKNFLIASQTGSGKTLAFGIPIIQDLLRKEAEGKLRNKFYALILSPTRELSIQIIKHLQSIIPENSAIRQIAIIGGLSAQKQERFLKKSHIIVATPGRLYDLMQNDTSALIKLDNTIKYLVVDEADRMIELGHFNQLDKIVTKINSKHTINSIPKEVLQQKQPDLYLKNGQKVQLEEENLDFIEDEQQEESEEENRKFAGRKVFLVSATLTQQFDEQGKFKRAKQGIQNSEDMIPKLHTLISRLEIQNKFKVVDLTQNIVFPEKLSIKKVICSEDDKMLYLYQILKEHPQESFMVFLNSITYAKKIKNLLSVLNIKGECLHSEQQQRQRLKKVDRFKKKEETKVLICTDVAARGLDIPNVEIVVHYQIPNDMDTFVHRCGRSARIYQSGTAYCLIGPKDVDAFLKIEKAVVKYTSKTINNYDTDLDQLDSIRNLISNGIELEKEQHSVSKLTTQKLAIKKSLQQEEFEEPELRKELEEIDRKLEGRTSKLRKERKMFEKMSKYKQSEQIYSRRRNAVFLTPDMVDQLMKKQKR